MKYNDIEVGQFYLYDKDNEYNRVDSDIPVVKVASKSKVFFRPTILVYPVIPGRGVVTNQPFYLTHEGMISKMSNNPADNVIIRYPANIPVFSIDDTNVISKAFMYALNHANDCKLSEQEVLKMSTLVQKVKFYAEISEKYRPVSNESGEQHGGL